MTLAVPDHSKHHDGQRYREQVVPPDTMAGLVGLGGNVLGEGVPVGEHTGQRRQHDNRPTAASFRTDRLREAMQRLVQLYDDWGKPAEAARWRMKVDAKEKKK